VTSSRTGRDLRSWVAYAAMSDGGEPGQIKRFGNYEVLRFLGEAGGARVYRARQVSVDRLVTLTILPRQHMDKIAFRTRFERQVAAASKLRHPNILSAIDAGSIGGHQYLVAESVSGRRLSEQIADGEWFGVGRAVRIALAVARALEHIDAGGMLHRNLTPQCVLIGEGDLVKLRGFSFSRPQRQSVSETWFDADDYNVLYKSPDWVTHKTLDIRSDLYSLGCILYELLTGRPPYRGGTSAQVLERHVKQALPDPSALRSDVSPDLKTVVVRLLAKDREDRYETPGEAVADLEAIEQGKPIASPKGGKRRGFFGRGK
jgi:serine/threonine protein kinase